MRASSIQRIFLGLAAGLALAVSLPPVSAGARASVVEKPYQRLIERTARRHGLDERLFEALVEVESGRRTDAVSSKGARGLAQLMPATARRFDVRDPHDPADNLEGAARYLLWLLDRYEGDTELALAAYNAGEGAVDRYGGIPNYPETRSFVRRVLARADLAGRSGARERSGPRPARLIREPDGRIIITNLP